MLLLDGSFGYRLSDLIACFYIKKLPVTFMLMGTCSGQQHLLFLLVAAPPHSTLYQSVTVPLQAGALGQQMSSLPLDALNTLKCSTKKLVLHSKQCRFSVSNGTEENGYLKSRYFCLSVICISTMPAN